MHSTFESRPRKVNRRPLNYVSALALLAVGLSAACTAVIDGRQSGGDTVTAAGSATTPGPAAAGSAGSAGTATAGGPLRVATEPLHRLNRLEYDNTVRDLLGTSLTPARAFPPDPRSDGLDNAADGLTFGATLFDLYLSAAKELAASTLDAAPRFQQHLLAAEHHKGGVAYGTWGWLVAAGEISGSLDVPQAESAIFSVLAGGTTSQAAVPAMTLYLDGKALKTWTVSSPVSAPTVFSVEAPLAAGQHGLKLTFDNRENNAPANKFNHLVVGYIDVASKALTSPKNRGFVYACEPATAADRNGCYRTIIAQFAARAWRRPLTPGETNELWALWQKLEANEETALELLVRAILVSPKFLFRVSVPGSYATAALAGTTDSVPLDDYALASRLSYFLWSSMPDQALFDDAQARALRDNAGLQAAVRRMLQDEKAAAIIDGFAEQWLDVRALANVMPDPETYPAFDAALKPAMAEQAKLFFGDFLHNGRPLADMLAPGFDYLNDILADHYGLPGPRSAKVVRVALPSGARGGLLMQGAWLTATSEATRTSPVRRGRFVLEELLCSPVPPPPDNVPPFEEGKQGATIRETLAAHRANPACAGCHDLLDPIGLGLEELDGIGALRTQELGKPVDSSGALPPLAVPFAGAAQLAALLKDDPRFVGCLSRKLMAYALGRRFAETDAGFYDAIVGALPGHGSSLDQLLELIVLSPAFRARSANLTE